MTLPAALVNVAFREFTLSSMFLSQSNSRYPLEGGYCLVTAAIAINAVVYVAAALPLLIGVLYSVQRFYLKTSRQLRLLEYEAWQLPCTTVI
jgi:ATP-binding cassette, subfamily C (CFTR/MRP), member 1